MVKDLVHNLCESLVENIGGVAGVGKNTPPTPVTYLTQWKIVGNSEVHGQEIWSCGEYNATDGKYHILVQPQGGSIVDIALTEPLRMVGDVADTIEFPSDTEGKALVTRNIKSRKWNNVDVIAETSRFRIRSQLGVSVPSTVKEGTHKCLSVDFVQDISPVTSSSQTDKAMVVHTNGVIYVRDTNTTSVEDFYTKYGTHEFVYILATPTTELVDAPQIQEADSYTCVISQGGKAISWSEFLYYSGYLLTDSENNILVDSEDYQLTVQN